MSSGRRTYRIKAMCPGCQKEYMAYPEYKWTGRGIPRLRCEACKQLAGWYYGKKSPRLEYDIIERGA